MLTLLVVAAHIPVKQLLEHVGKTKDLESFLLDTKHANSSSLDSKAWSDSLNAYMSVDAPEEAMNLFRYVLFLGGNREGFLEHYLSSKPDVRAMLLSSPMWHAQFL